MIFTLILIISFGVLISSNVFAVGKLNIVQNNEWICKNNPNDEYDCIIEDKNKQKTKVSFCHKEITDQKDLPNKKIVYLDKEKTKSVQLNKKNKDGKVCYERLVDTETYLSFNPEVVWQEKSMIQYMD